MKHYAWLLGGAMTAVLVTGCVDRRYVIESNPPGAVVLCNGVQLGAASVDNHFVYYGDYNFTLIKDGYQTKKIKQNIPAPWYQWFPIDFFAENLYPHRTVDVRRFKYDLEPLPAVRTDELLNKAQALRTRGQAITPPPENSTSNSVDATEPVKHEAPAAAPQ
jgi:hypothetical protein